MRHRARLWRNKTRACDRSTQAALRSRLTYGRVCLGRSPIIDMDLRKDKALDVLAEQGNVAQFVSFTPSAGGPESAYCRIAGIAPNARFGSTEQAIAALLVASSE